MVGSRIAFCVVIALWAVCVGPAGLSRAAARPSATVRDSSPTLIETLIVDMGSDTVAKSKTMLHAGAHYRIEVSGTWTWTESGTTAGWNFDALFCYNDFGWQTPQCRPQYRHALLYVGTNTSQPCPKQGQYASCAMDAYQVPGGGGSDLAYSDSHDYTADFYPLYDGPLTAGSFQAYDQCAKRSTCTTGLSGTLTIRIYSDSATVTLPAHVRNPDSPSQMKD